MIRAMSRRTTRTRLVFSSCPLALETQVELLLAQLDQLRLELVGRLSADVSCLHRIHPY